MVVVGRGKDCLPSISDPWKLATSVPSFQINVSNLCYGSNGTVHVLRKRNTLGVRIQRRQTPRMEEGMCEMEETTATTEDGMSASGSGCSEGTITCTLEGPRKKGSDQLL